MYKYLLKRLALLVPVLFGVMLVIFTLNYITPGDPARIMAGEQAEEWAVEQLREEMGLNDPYITRLGRFIIDTVQFDLGRSLQTRSPVVREITARFPVTMQLAAMGVFLAVMVGVPLGILSATKQYSIFDNVVTVIGMVGVSITNFWLALMLVLLFAVNLGWLPATGWTGLSFWILPALTVAAPPTAVVMRFTRSSMIEVVRQDYIRTARAKGQNESKVIFYHALRNALIPVITVIGLQFGFLLGGAVLTETIFAIPGLGRYLVDSINTRDYPVIQGGVFFIALAFSLVNLIVDILYAFVDPRIRSQYK